MSIALYDVDLAHNIMGWIPNLELMKVFEYYYSRNKIVKVITEQKNLKRFSKIIIFKNSPTLKFPQEVLAQEHSEIYGYGFYNRFIPLAEKYRDCKPNYFAYLFFEDRIKNKKKYNKIKNNNIVRVENRDLSGFNKDKKWIFVADHNFLELENAYDFLLEFKKYKIDFLEPLIAKSKEQLIKFYPKCYNSSRRIIIDFDWDDSLFQLYYNEKVLFSFSPKIYNQSKKELIRIINLILWVKGCGETIKFDFLKINSKEKKMPYFNLLQEILKWGETKTQLPFVKFSPQKFDECLNFLLENSEIRLSLKINPMSQSLDFI